MATGDTAQPPKPSKALTVTKLAAIDDLATDVLVDKVFFWTRIRKNRARYSACRGVKEEQVTNIIRQHVIIDDDPRLALETLMALPGFDKTTRRLLQDIDRHHIVNHLRKYVDMYSPEAPFEIATTNRYTINVEEAAVVARRDIRKGEQIRHLTGIQVPITPEEEQNMDLTRRDFSIVVSSRKRMSSLFLGPARFANHDCDANAKLQTKGPSGMSVHAAKNIKKGEEITVSYGENYFGIDNCECLCGTCEWKQRNGWAIPEENEDEDEGSAAGPSSRAVSAPTPDGSNPTSRALPPRISRGRHPRQHEDVIAQPSGKRKLDQVEDVEESERVALRSEEARLKAAFGGPSHDAVRAAIDRGRALRSSPENPTKSIEDSGYASVAGSVGSNEPSNGSENRDHLRAPLDAIPSRFHVATTNGKPTSINGSSASPGFDTRKRMAVSNILNHSGSPSPRESNEPTNYQSGVNGHAPSPGIGAKSRSAPAVATHVTQPEAHGSRIIRADSTDSQAPEVPSVSERVTAKRRPGDYTLTEALLAEPYSRWVECGNCGEMFVQCNAYQTRFSCPRCERHSKLYGFRWPKTMKAHEYDEERILDHREIDRFVNPSEEKTISKGKARALKLLKDARDAEDVRSDSNPEPTERTKNGRTFRASLGMRKLDETDFAEDSHPRKKPKTKRVEASSSSPAPVQSGKTTTAAKKIGHKAQLLKGNQKFKIVKSSKKMVGVKKNYRDPNRPKRKYHRTGLFSRDPEIRDAAEKKIRAMNAQKEAEFKARRRQEEKEKKEAERRAAKAEAAKRPARPSPRWKGYVLEVVPGANETRSPKKLYTNEGKRWEPEESNEDEEPKTPAQEPRPKRVIKPTAKSGLANPATPGSGLRNQVVMDDSDDDIADSPITSSSRQVVADSDSEAAFYVDSDADDYSDDNGGDAPDSEWESESDSGGLYAVSKSREKPASVRQQAPAKVTGMATRGADSRRVSSSATPVESRKDSREVSSAADKSIAQAKPSGKKTGLPKGWAWPDEEDINKRKQIDADKEAREEAVRAKRR